VGGKRRQAIKLFIKFNSATFFIFFRVKINKRKRGKNPKVKYRKKNIYVFILCGVSGKTGGRGVAGWKQSKLRRHWALRTEAVAAVVAVECYVIYIYIYHGSLGCHYSLGNFSAATKSHALFSKRQSGISVLLYNTVLFW